MKWKRYNKYKNSCIEWLGDIPEGWEVIRLKYVFWLQRGHDLPATEFNEGKYPVYGSNGCIGYHNQFTTKGPGVTVGRSGSVGEVNYVCSDYWAHNTTLYVKEFRRAKPRYVFYLLKTLDVKYLSEGTAVGTLNRNYIHDLPIAIPVTAEQHAIAAFLDRETARIDALIEKKERQIELLKEKRVALIHEAIQEAATRNLRVGYVANQIQRPIGRMDDEIYVPIGMYNRGRGIFHKEPIVGAELGDSDFFWVEPNDLILSGQFAWEGAVALAGEEDVGCVATHRYPILRGKPGLMDTAYLFAFFTTKTGEFLLNEHSRGAAGRNRPLNAGTLLKEVIPVPPLAAQLSVSKHVYFERRFRRIVANSTKLLAEYRTAIISAAVTGKIDVRKEVA